MKKILLLSFCLGIAISSFSQGELKRDNNFIEKLSKSSRSLESNYIWSDDFSDPSTWIIDHNEYKCNLDWEIGTDLSCGGIHPIETIASPSYENGYAMIDSDEYGGETAKAEVEDSWFTTADSINLSNHEHVVIQFETWYQSFSSEKCFLVTSTTNEDWPQLDPDFDANTNPNVYEVFPSISGDPRENVGANPTLYRINISESAGNQDKVWVRFHWTGTYGYAWFIDDVAIIEQPKNDIILNTAWMTNGSMVEYGRIPVSQTSDTLILGGVVSNFGIDAQENVRLNLSVRDQNDNEIIDNSATLPLLKNDSIALYSLPTASNITSGSYQLVASASSDLDNDSIGDHYTTNNTYTRNFEITEELYSVDGIGVYEESKRSLSSMGTNSFIEDQDGLIMMVYYRVIEQTEVAGIEIAITKDTEPGAYVYPFILDGEARLNVDVYDDRITQNMEDNIVKQWHIDEGKMWLPLPKTTLEPGVYYACVELFSLYGSNHINIYDDKTIIQPDGVSNIYSPNDDRIYTNGNAFAIRLGLNNYVNLEESTQEHFTIFPNPSTGIFRVNATKPFTKIEIINVLGEIVCLKTDVDFQSETFDLSKEKSGIYLAVVHSDKTKFTQRLILK